MHFQPSRPTVQAPPCFQPGNFNMHFFPDHANMSNQTPESSSKPSNPASPTRPKHLTTRSFSEIHHKHHHPHLHHHRRKEEPQSAHPSYEGTSSKSEGVTPGGSRDVSRRGSMLVQEIPEWTGREKRVVTEGEVREEREKGIRRAAYALSPCITSSEVFANRSYTASYGMHCLDSILSQSTRPVVSIIPTTPSSKNSAPYKTQSPL